MIPRKALLPLALLGGCAAVAGRVPTLNYCESIGYQRDGNKIHLEADCQVPMDDGSTDWEDVVKGIAAALLMGM